MTGRATPGQLGHGAAVLALLGLAAWLASLQDGPFAWPTDEWARLAAAIAAVLVYALVSVVLYRNAARSRSGTAERSEDVPAVGIDVVFASQTGFAEELARRTAGLLRAAAVSTRVVALGNLPVGALCGARSVLFVVSTTGEGDPPDGALGFMRTAMTAQPDLSGLRYAVLSLGDSDYARYCGFGRALDAWLTRHGAASLFDTVEVDDGDEAALRHWHHQVGRVAGRTDLPDWEAPRYARWRLRERILLNTGSQGDPCFLVKLEPPAGEPVDWQAGDIIEIGPCNDPAEVQLFLSARSMDGAVPVPGAGAGHPDATLAAALGRLGLPRQASGPPAHSAALVAALSPLPHREYTIASLPGDGAVELVVRQTRRPDGRLGIGSGWLTHHAAVGDDIDARVRGNSAFHAPDSGAPMVLIGNGTGIAGLRAHLRARVAAGHRRNWLLFGERNAGSDFLFRDELLRLRADGWLDDLDVVFSRDQPGKRYVQDRLRERMKALEEWLAEGAVIYVCGSLAGMAPGVHAALIEGLGADAVAELTAGGRYRRDVY